MKYIIFMLLVYISICLLIYIDIKEEVYTSWNYFNIQNTFKSKHELC